MIILHWLDRSPCWYHTFVRNRISTILSNLSPTSWHYVPTQDNPADCASQGLLPQALLDHHLWWRGPDWLQIDPISWHPQPFSSPIGTPELSEAVCNLMLPVRPEWIEERYSSYSFLLHINAWILHLQAVGTFKFSKYKYNVLFYIHAVDKIWKYEQKTGNVKKA